MLRKLIVNELFGIYNYEIDFNNEENTKIITGPNGYGKSTILKILDNLLNNRFWFFYYLDFTSIAVEFSSCNFFIRKCISDENNLSNDGDFGRDSYDYKVIVELRDLSNKEIESVEINSTLIQRLLRIVKRNNLERYSYISDVELLSSSYSQDIINDFPLRLKNISLILQGYDSKYLSSQRLYSFGEHQFYRSSFFPSYQIDKVNDLLIHHYQNAQFLFASECQRIDATYIPRLISIKKRYSPKELQDQLEKLKKIVADYKALNLLNDMEVLDLSKSYEDIKNNNMIDVLSLYVEDMNKKMDKLNALYEKVRLFKSLLDKKILSEKEIIISEKGMSFKNSKGKELTNLHLLSSGEQNLLILYYNMIFETSSHSILLIDEPENSLHVAWQSRMLEDYIQISNNTKCQIILATHSPILINNRWDLTTDLYRQHKGKH